MDCIILIEGMLGKAFGVVGGYVIGFIVLVDFIRSFVLGFIFIIVLLFAVAVVVTVLIWYFKISQFECVLQCWQVAKLCVWLDVLGILYLLNSSHIILVMIGDLVKCCQISDILMDSYGIYVQPINYLTVLKGGEWLCLTFLLLHTDVDIDYLVNLLGVLWK